MFKSICTKLLNYIPGFVILVFGMLALHSSLQVMKIHETLIADYAQKSRNIYELEKSFDVFEDVLSASVNYQGHEVYQNLEKAFTVFTERYYEMRYNDAYIAIKNITLSRLFSKIDAQIVTLSGVMVDVSNNKNLNEESYGHVLHDIHENIEQLWAGLYEEESFNFLTLQIKKKEMWLYWSVVVLGFSGFLLVLLNSEKLYRLNAFNAEKKDYLKLLEDRLAAMESTYDGIGIVNAEGELIYMNKALRKLHGIEGEEEKKYIGQKWTSLYSNKGKENIQEKMLPFLEKHGFWRGEVPIVRGNGELVCAELSLTTLPDGGMIGTARDITKEKETEEEKELLQSQFYQAQKMEAIGRLAGGVAHDFNNILASINGYAEFLMEDLDCETSQHKFAKNILMAGQEARALVDQILTFSRQSEDSFKCFDINEPITKTLTMLESSLSRSIEVKAEINTSRKFVYGNEAQFSQVLMNLCVNAKDAIEGHGTITLGANIMSFQEARDLDVRIMGPDDGGYKPAVEIHKKTSDFTRLCLGVLVKGRDYVCITVEDTGSGINASVIEKIFEPFFTTKPVNKGTGLGLSAVHGVVTGHKGVLILESEVRKGTIFRILFPIYDAPADEVLPENEDGQVYVSSKILLVEDEESVREVNATKLQRLGAEVIIAKNGAHALEVLKEIQGFDLVITDQNMPEMSGLEMIEEAHKKYPDLPFVILSGYSQRKLQRMIPEHDAIKAVLRKPISKKDLAASISTVLLKHKEIS